MKNPLKKKERICMRNCLKFKKEVENNKLDKDTLCIHINFFSRKWTPLRSQIHLH
jgi:hypothetical protein